jgi:hypothetical protein
VLLKEKSVSDKMLLSSSMIKSNQIRTCFRDLYFIKPNLFNSSRRSNLERILAVYVLCTFSLTY